jgi:hypothetical protein
MSEMRLVIRDAGRAIYGNIHGHICETAVAALIAEPETIEELDLAMQRFAAPSLGGHFGGFHSGEDDQPYDAGALVIDLAARLVACESSYFAPSTEGWVAYNDGHAATDIGVRYHLSDEWELTGDLLTWRGRAESRRRDRQANPPIDARAVLYGQAMVEFIAGECLAAFAGRPTPVEAEGDREQVRQIHIKWMMSPR